MVAWLSVTLVAPPALTASQVGSVALAPPGVSLPYVADPACPGEGCVYGEWMACDSVPLFASVDGADRPVAWLDRNERFTVEHGLAVIHEPAVYVAERPVRDDSIGWESWLPMDEGDTLYVFDYLGEGFSNVWWRGAMREVFQFWRGSPPDSIHPALRRLQASRSEFWVRTNSPGDGTSRWVRVTHPQVLRAGRYDVLPEACPQAF